jgi:hypothetical protein
MAPPPPPPPTCAVPVFLRPGGLLHGLTAQHGRQVDDQHRRIWDAVVPGRSGARWHHPGPGGQPNSGVAGEGWHWAAELGVEVGVGAWLLRRGCCHCQAGQNKPASPPAGRQDSEYRTCTGPRCGSPTAGLLWACWPSCCCWPAAKGPSLRLWPKHLARPWCGARGARYTNCLGGSVRLVVRYGVWVVVIVTCVVFNAIHLPQCHQCGTVLAREK